MTITQDQIRSILQENFGDAFASEVVDRIPKLIPVMTARVNTAIEHEGLDPIKRGSIAAQIFASLDTALSRYAKIMSLDIEEVS